MAAAGMFLLIGCANVSNLVLAACALASSGDCDSNGAGRGYRPDRPANSIAESCVLGLAGGLAGYALTVVAWMLLPQLAPASIPRLASARPDWTVFAFTFAVSIANGILFGLGPRFVRRTAIPLRRYGNRPREAAIGGAHNRLRSALVIAEVAVAVTLVS